MDQFAGMDRALDEILVQLGGMVLRLSSPQVTRTPEERHALARSVNQYSVCAAHSGDLNSARGFGLRTGFIYRPNEHGVGGPHSTAKPGEFDVVSKDMLDLAAQLGA